MFFMTPQIIEKAALNNALKGDAEALAKEDATKLTTAIKEYLRPVKKSVHFRQQA